jgi:hypothetical protein
MAFPLGMDSKKWRCSREKNYLCSKKQPKVCIRVNGMLYMNINETLKKKDEKCEY